MASAHEESEHRIIASKSDNRPALDVDELSQNRASLLRFVKTKVADMEVAEDLVQDVIYQFLRSSDASEPIEDATAWMFRAARNRVVDWYRKRKHERLEEFDPDGFDSETTPFEPAVDEPGPQMLLEDADFQAAFLEALEELPEEQREIFIKHELEGIPFSELVETTGVKQNTLLSRKRYAMLALRKRLRIFR